MQEAVSPPIITILGRVTLQTLGYFYIDQVTSKWCITLTVKISHPLQILLAGTDYGASIPNYIHFYKIQQIGDPMPAPHSVGI